MMPDGAEHLYSILAGNLDGSTGIVILETKGLTAQEAVDALHRELKQIRRKDFNASRSARCISRTGIVDGCSGCARTLRDRTGPETLSLRHQRAGESLGRADT